MGDTDDEVQISVAVALLMIGSGAAVAKDAKTATLKVHSPESIECTKQADAKSLHGKERKTFRATCKKQLQSTKATATKKPDAMPAEKKS